MSKNAEKTLKAGMFIFIGLVLLSAFLVVMSGYQSSFLRVSLYKIVLDDSTGLFSGSYVTVNGMRVGNVQSLDLEEGKVFLTLSIRNRFKKFITQNSVASLKTRGLLGDRYISIETDADSPVLPPGSFIKTENIGEEKKDNDLLSNMTNLVQELSTFVSKLNKGDQNSDLATELNKVSQQVRKLLSDGNRKNAQEVLTHLKSILKKIDKGEGTLGAIVNDKELHNKAMGALGKNAYSNILKYLFGGGKKPDRNLEEESSSSF